jgi:transmembrane sensor
MLQLRLFGRGSIKGGSTELEEALDSSAQKLGLVEPETDRQWRLLSAALAGRTADASLRPRARFAWVLRPALGVALIAGVIVVGLVLRKPDVQNASYETVRGQQTTLNLADGSEVMLNHTSALTVEMAAGGDARRVSLAGEAFFRVRKTGAPFVVTTGVGTVTVLGTEFNVRMRDGRMEVAVIQGSVRVAGGAAGELNNVMLTAGEVTSCLARGVPSPPAKLLHASYPGWIHGQLLFDRTPLSAACRELENHFDIALTLSIPRADDIMITGALDAKNADLAVATLARLTGATYSHDQSGYTLR